MSLKYAELYTLAGGGREDAIVDEACLRASAYASTSGEAFFAHSGSIHIVDEHMQCTHAFPTYPEVKFLTPLRKGRLLVVLGASNAAELVSSTCIGFWSPTSAHSSDWKSLLDYQPFKAHQAHEAAVTAWAVFDQGDKISVLLALHTSPCVVLQHDFKVLVQSTGAFQVSRLRNSRRITIDALDDRRDGRITNLLITRGSGAPSGAVLFMSTETRVLTMDFNLPTPEFSTLDTIGAAAGCVAAYEADKIALCWAYPATQAPSAPGYFGQLCTYTAEAKAACIPLQFTPKGFVTSLGPRLLALVASKPKDPLSDAVVIVDPHSRLELHREEQQNDVLALMAAFGGVLTIRKSGSWALVRPASLATMLATLKKKRLYEQAMSIAQEHTDGTPEIVAQLEAEYAAFLFNACEPEAAMQHYINTIGFVPVSTVVKSFMGMQHSALLTQYLEQVHAKGRMISVHVLVLLGLYCQMRESERLRTFIANSIVPGQGYKYDADEAIRILITGGYLQEAKQVAEADALHEDVIDICLHQLGNAGEAIAYITTLGRQDRAAALKRHGFSLVREFGKEMEVTKLLMDLCTRAAEPADKYLASVTEFSHVYAHAPGAWRVLCEYLHQEWEKSAADSAAPQRAEERIVYHQLLQLYLSDALNADKDGLDRDTRLAKAERLLKDGWPSGAPWVSGATGENAPKYSPDHALELCAKNRFKPGLVFLYRKQGATMSLLQVYVQFGDHKGLLECIQELGGGEHWYPALKHFVALEDSDQAERLITLALLEMQSDPYVQPQHVLEILSQSPSLPLAAVRPFFVAHISQMEAKAAADHNKARKLSEETAKLTESIERTRTSALRVRSAFDSESNEALALPSIHFFCGHAFNEHNCDTSEGEGPAGQDGPGRGSVFRCKICKKEQKDLLDLTTASQVSREEQHNSYFRDLRMATDDGFGVIARHLSNPATLI